MLAALSSLDFGVLALYLAVLLAVGVYHGGRQKNATEFFLGSRSLGWFPLGMSLAATLVSILSYTGIPGQAYERGLLCLIVPASFWLVMPIVVLLVVPLYRGLGLTSIYEYLELRFDGRVRLLASLIFIAWRLLWLVGMICLPAWAIQTAAGAAAIPIGWPIALLGVGTTLYTFLGGLRAIVWTNVIHVFAMLVGVAVVIAGVWLQLDGGPQRVAEIASGLGRLKPIEFTFQSSDPWMLWGALPHWILALLSFLVADQITAQRLLSAKTVNAARTSYLIGTLTLSILLPGLIYAGLCLLAFYYDHPRAMRPEWVANVDGRTRAVLRDDAGRSLLDETNPAHELRWENIDSLVAERRILQPNNKEPFTSTAELIDPDTNRVRVEKLAMRRPPQGRLNGEVIVARGSPQKMLPQFVARHLPWGAAGLVLVALVAAAMSGIDSGLCSISTLLMTDMHRRYGWGRAWLAGWLGKQPEQLTAADELRLARPLTLAIGLAATALALGMAQIAAPFRLVLDLASAIGGPLLAVFLLGMLTRRATATAALLAIVLGGLLALGLTTFNRLTSPAIAETWNVVGGVLCTVVVGYVASFVVGRRKSNVELRGLVAGCGTLGLRATDEEMPLIDVPGAADAARWS